MSATVVKLLDAAGDAAWDSRSKGQAIAMAQVVLKTGAGEDSAAAFTAWCRAVDYHGPRRDLDQFLAGRYRDRGDIALSLQRAAVLTQQSAYSDQTTT
jgi:hypothetical protein